MLIKVLRFLLIVHFADLHNHWACKAPPQFSFLYNCPDSIQLASPLCCYAMSIKLCPSLILQSAWNRKLLQLFAIISRI